MSGNNYDALIRQLAESVFEKLPNVNRDRRHEAFGILFRDQVLKPLRAAKASKEAVSDLIMRSRCIYDTVRKEHARKRQPFDPKRFARRTSENDKRPQGDGPTIPYNTDNVVPRINGVRR